jgi:hypothetical protein
MTWEETFNKDSFDAERRTVSDEGLSNLIRQLILDELVTEKRERTKK